MATSNIFKSPKITKLIRFDWFMKHMLRDKSNFEILEGFLSELLKEDIKIIEIIDGEANKSHKKDKFNRVDILVKTAIDERVIIEIQNNTEFDYLQRILYGACKTIVENMQSGDTYDTIKKVISISIVYFPVAQGGDYVYLGQTQFKGIHLNDVLTLLPEQQELFNRQSLEQLYPNFYLIKAGDFEGKEMKDTLDEWIYFLKTGDVKEGFSAKGLDKAKKKLDVAKMIGKKRREYAAYEESLHSEASWNMQQLLDIKRAEKKAMEKGMAKGMEKGEAIGVAKGEAIGVAKGEAIGVAKGEAIGVAKGEVIGVAKGEVIGEARAEARSRAVFVLRLHKKGKNAEEISDLTDISLEKVIEIISNFKQK